MLLPLISSTFTWRNKQKEKPHDNIYRLHNFEIHFTDNLSRWIRLFQAFDRQNYFLEFGEGFFKGTFYIQIGRNAALLIEVVKGKYLKRLFQFEIGST